MGLDGVGWVWREWDGLGWSGLSGLGGLELVWVGLDGSGWVG